MKKLVSIFLIGVGLVISGCTHTSEPGQVNYSLKNNGVNLKLTVKYDENKNVTKTIAKNTYDYKKMGSTKKEIKSNLEDNIEIYKEMDGVKETLEFEDMKATETLIVTIKEVEPDSLLLLYSVSANEDGTLSLDNLGKSLENVGFTKK